jgi:superfamily II DNA or RNA helicase
MRLAFDRGTVTLTGCSDREAAGLPGVLWDPRARIHRAPAHRYSDLVAALRDASRRFEDRVRGPGPGPGRWRELDLHPHQAAALASWQLAGARGLVVLPSGAGKTRLALAAMAREGRRALCLVPTRVLLAQWRAELAGCYDGPIGQYGDGRRALEAVTVATFASALRHMETLGNRFELLVVDEAHHFGTGPGDEALELCAAPARIGLTATPPSDPAQRGRLARLVGPEVYRQSVADLSGAYLAPLRIVTLALDLAPDERRAYAAELAVYQPAVRQFFRYAPRASWRDFQRAAQQTDAGRRALAAWRRSRKLVGFTQAKRAALSRLLHEHRGSRLLVFAGDNETAYAIARDHCIMPITCDIGRAERADALAAFHAGRLRALVSAQVLNEGIDVPDAGRDPSVSAHRSLPGPGHGFPRSPKLAWCARWPSWLCSPFPGSRPPARRRSLRGPGCAARPSRAAPCSSCPSRRRPVPWRWARRAASTGPASPSRARSYSVAQTAARWLARPGCTPESGDPSTSPARRRPTTTRCWHSKPHPRACACSSPPPGSPRRETACASWVYRRRVLR